MRGLLFRIDARLWTKQRNEGYPAGIKIDDSSIQSHISLIHMRFDRSVESETGMEALEIDLRRLLYRLQGTLADASHGSADPGEIQRRWTYVRHAETLLARISSQAKLEEDARRLQSYESKLKFISELM